MELQKLINDSPSLIETLTLLTEESAEVTKCVQKIYRSGLDFKPFNGETSNLDNLKTEIVDLLVILDKAIEQLDMTNEFISDRKAIKIEKLKVWTKVFNSD